MGSSSETCSGRTAGGHGVRQRWLAAAGALALSALLVSAAASAPPQTTSFTITAIEPDVDKGIVRLRFDRPLPVWVLRQSLRFVPPVRLFWEDMAYHGDQAMLELKGEFIPGNTYALSLPEVLSDNYRYVKAANERFTVPDFKRNVAFAEPKTVVERDSRQLVHLVLTNVDEVMVESLSVPPLLLPLAMDFDGLPGGTWPRSADLLEKAAGAAAGLGEIKAWRPFLGTPRRVRQLFFTQGEKNRLRPFSMPLTFRPEKEKGSVELLRIYDNRPDPFTATNVVLGRVTDLGLTYKLSDADLLVWATSLSKGLPVKGAALLALTRDGHAFPLGKTDGDGLFIYRKSELEGIRVKPELSAKPVKRPVDPAEILTVAAVTGDDVSFINLGPAGRLKPVGINQVEDVDRKPGPAVKGYLFTERGVYRPGETVFVKGFVREYSLGAIAPPAAGKYRLEVVSPKQERVFSGEETLGAFGTASWSFPVKAFHPLGTYTATLFQGTEAKASRTFMVQEFKPPRHYTEISFARTSRKEPEYVNLDRTGDYLAVTVTGLYYAGGPVKHGKVRWKLYHARTRHEVKGFEAYDFGYPSERDAEDSRGYRRPRRDEPEPDLLETGESMLDENGRLVLEFPVDREVASGKLAYEVSATVLDFDARAAAARKLYAAKPGYCVGVGRHPAQVNEGEQAVIPVVVVDGSGDRVGGGKVDVDVLQLRGLYVRKRNEQGHAFWVYQETWKKAYAGSIDLEDGEALFTASFAWWGKYLVTFTYRDGEGKAYTAGTVLETGGGRYEGEESREKPYEDLALTADRASYRPGEKAVLRFAPRKPVSRYLVTLERRGVMEAMVVKAKADTRSLEIPLKADYPPNVYVSVLGLVPRTGFPVHNGAFDDEAPAFLYGVVNLPVMADPEKLAIGIAEDRKKLKAEPGAEVRLDLSVTGEKGKGIEAEVAVAVVDESFLALTGFATPSLDDLVRFDIPLSVFTGELRSLLLPQSPFDTVRLSPLTGGGGLELEAEGLTSKARKRFDPVAYFNPAVLTDASGKAAVSFTLPDTMTTYRVYAVACDKGSRFASHQRALVAAKDFYLEPGLPSFFNRGDRFAFPVAAFNATEESGPMRFALKTEGGLNLSAASLNYQLNGMDSTRVRIAGEALAAGPASVTFGGEFAGRRDAVHLTVPVNSGYVLGTESLNGRFSREASVTFPLPEAVRAIDWKTLGFHQVAGTVTLSTSPLARMTDGLRYLLHYPYGCVEQTSSGVIGLASVRNLVKEGLIPVITLDEVDKFLTGGVARLLSMQTDSGAFTYWPGQAGDHPWGTIYALNALTMARTAGFDIPGDRLQKALVHLKAVVSGPADHETTDSLRAFGLYILAANGALDQGTFQSQARRLEGLGRESRMLVLMAAKRAGLVPDNELRKQAAEALAAPWKTGGPDEFHAIYREPALALLLGTYVLPGDPLTDAAAERLYGGIGERGIWTSTSDTGWGLFALGEYLKGTAFAKETIRVTVSQEGGAKTTVDLDPKAFRTVELDPALFLKDPRLSLTSSAEGTVLFKVELTFPRADWAAGGHEAGFKVSKTIDNTDGSKTIRIGDIVLVGVTVVSAGQYARYVVLDDPLPAGLVAVNSALQTEESPAGREEREEDYYYYWSPDGYYRFVPNFFEIRNDRVLAFRDDLWGGSFRYSYYARAVCEGTFVVPSTKVELMYQHQVNGYSPASTLTVLGR